MGTKIIDGTGSTRAAKVDNKHRLWTNGVNLTHAHHEIHIGHSYVIDGSQTTANSDDNQTVLTFKTPTTEEVHMFVEASVTGAAWLYVYESPTVVNNTGTSTLTAYNRNRLSRNISELIDTKSNPNVKNSVTFWDETDAAGANITLGDGTLIYSEQIAAGRASFATTRGQAEFILMHDTIYGIALENEGATANIHNIILNWYED